LLAPVWIAGLVRLFRDPALRWCRAIGWAYVVLAVVFLVTGGKGYYLAGLFPVLLATGAQPTIDWMRRGRAGLRRALVVLAVVLSLGSMPVTLPLETVGSLHTTGIVKLNYDAGETVAWPIYVSQIADVYSGLPSARRQATAIVTGNYGDAGAVDRFGPSLGLPHSYSGHMGFWYWGPPPESATGIVAVSLGGEFLRRFFVDCTLATTLHNPYHLDNDEQGNPVWVCSGRRGSWQAIWPHFKST